MEIIATVYSAEMREKALVDTYSGAGAPVKACEMRWLRWTQKAPITCMNLTVSDCDLVAVGTSWTGQIDPAARVNVGFEFFAIKLTKCLLRYSIGTTAPVEGPPGFK